MRLPLDTLVPDSSRTTASNNYSNDQFSNLYNLMQLETPTQNAYLNQIDSDQQFNQLPNFYQPQSSFNQPQLTDNYFQPLNTEPTYTTLNSIIATPTAVVAHSDTNYKLQTTNPGSSRSHLPPGPFQGHTTIISSQDQSNTSVFQPPLETEPTKPSTSKQTSTINGYYQKRYKHQASHNQDLQTINEDDESTDMYGGQRKFFEVVKESTKSIRKLGCKETTVDLIINDPKLNNLLEAGTLYRDMFTAIFAQLIDPLPSTHMVRVVIMHEDFDNPVSMEFVDKDELTVEMVFQSLDLVVQSKKKNSNFEQRSNKKMQIAVFSVDNPKGRGRKALTKEIIQERVLKKTPQLKITTPATQEEWILYKRCIRQIYNEDNLCLLRAIVTERSRHENPKLFTTYTNNRECRQLDKTVLALQKKFNLSNQACGYAEMELLDNFYLKDDYQLLVVNMEGTKVYCNMEKRRDDSTKTINLLLHNNHFDVINSMEAFYNRSYYCHYCKVPYNLNVSHRCPNTCRICTRQDCEIVTKDLQCKKCNKWAHNEQCLGIHMERICKQVTKCEICNQNLSSYRRHVCLDEVWCKNCAIAVTGDHRCYVKIKQPNKNEQKKAEKFEGFVFFDFEAYESEAGPHVVNLAKAKKVCVPCCELPISDHCVECLKQHTFYNILDFCKWALKQNNTILLAHNLAGYDGTFILDYVTKQKLPDCNVTPQVIRKHNKIVSITYKSIKFIDSLSYLPMPLAQFAKTFGFKGAKGFFPHTWNKPGAVQTYVGPYPPKSAYQSKLMTVGIKNEFDIWYEEVKNDTYDFKETFEEYCWNDVELLTAGCLKFRQVSLQDTGMDPFKVALTIAKYCNLVFINLHMVPDSIGIIPQNGFNPRQTSSRKARLYLKYTAETNDIRIQHAFNGGEVKCGPYFLDGVCEETKTIYEFHGCYWHGCPFCFKGSTFNSSKQMHQWSVLKQHHERIAYIKSNMPEYTLVEEWECVWDKKCKHNESVQAFISTTDFPEAMNPRDSLYGGRTQAFKLYHKCAEDEKIRYIDYTSLYPYIQKYGAFPTDHPEVITENFNYTTGAYFGIISLTILPPTNLRFPVLPSRQSGKLVFSLCRTCSINHCVTCDHTDEEREISGTYCTLEVDKALEEGYKIIKINEIWHYKERMQYDKATKTGGLFTAYQNNAMKKKVEASGWPESAKTDMEKEAYVKDFYDQEGIQLDVSQIEKNPGRRQLAKLMANNQWGFLGMNTHKPQFKIVQHLDELLALTSDDKLKINDMIMVTEQTLHVYYIDKREYHQGGLNTNVILASFVTSQARLKLYNEMSRLGDRVFYCDTDSIFFLSKPDLYEPVLGTNLGDFTNEIDIEDGTHIVEWATAGKKNYAYKTNLGNSHCTVKGFTFNYLTNLKLNFESLKRVVVQDQTEKIPCEQLVFKRDKKRMTITTSVQNKMYGFVYDTRVLFDNFETLPFGYKE